MVKKLYKQVNKLKNKLKKMLNLKQLNYTISKTHNIQDNLLSDLRKIPLMLFMIQDLLIYG